MGESIVKRVICVQLFDARNIILAIRSSNNPHIPTMVMSVGAINSDYGLKCVRELHTPENITLNA